MTIEFRMGSTRSEHLSITVLGREHACADDYWDGNWLVATISLAVLNQNLFGAALLESIEHRISLTVKAGSRGRIEISGELRDEAGSGNVLSFELAEVDQTYLAGWISSLDDIEKAYPVIGRP